MIDAITSCNRVGGNKKDSQGGAAARLVDFATSFTSIEKAVIIMKLKSLKQEPNLKAVARNLRIVAYTPHPVRRWCCWRNLALNAPSHLQPTEFLFISHRRKHCLLP